MNILHIVGGMQSSDAFKGAINLHNKLIYSGNND